MSKIQPLNIAKTGYVVSDATLASLARDYVSGALQVDSIRGGFLRILVAHTQRELERLNVRRPTQDGSLSAMQVVYDHLYAIVLQTVTTPDVAIDKEQPKEERARRAKERNRRTNFARSAKSTLVAAIKAGASVAKLKPEEVTKEALQAYSKPGPKSLYERISDTEARLEMMVKELVESDEDTARDFVGQVAERLSALLPARPETTPVARSRKRVGEIILHPH